MFTPTSAKAARTAAKLAAASGARIYETRFLSPLPPCRRVVRTASLAGHRATLGAFVLALVAFNGGVQKQFSRRRVGPELLVDLWLPRGFAQRSSDEACRSHDRQDEGDGALGQIHGELRRQRQPPFLSAARPASCSSTILRSWSSRPMGSRAARISNSAWKRLSRPKAGSGATSGARPAPRKRPAGRFPVQFRVSERTCRHCAARPEEMAEIMRAHPNIADVSFDWHEMAKAVRLEIDQERARALGVSVQDISALEYAAGRHVGHPVARGRPAGRRVVRARRRRARSLDALAGINVPTANGRMCRWRSWRRSTTPLEIGPDLATQPPADRHGAGRHPGGTAPPVSAQINPPSLSPCPAAGGLPHRVGGATEESAKAKTRSRP